MTTARKAYGPKVPIPRARVARATAAAPRSVDIAALRFGVSLSIWALVDGTPGYFVGDRACVVRAGGSPPRGVTPVRAKLQTGQLTAAGGWVRRVDDTAWDGEVVSWAPRRLRNGLLAAKYKSLVEALHPKARWYARQLKRGYAPFVAKEGDLIVAAVMPRQWHEQEVRRRA